jgi:hypothetical protein
MAVPVEREGNFSIDRATCDPVTGRSLTAESRSMVTIARR